MGGGKPGKYLLGDWWVGEELEASQRFCLEPALLVGEGRGAEEGARRGEKEGLAGGFSYAVAPGAPEGVTVVLITLPLESHNSPSVTRTIPPATGLLPPLYRL